MDMPKRKLRKRALMVLIVFTLLMLLLSSRLVYLQIIDGPNLQKEAIEQQTRDNQVASKRGTIYDRNMKALAQSATVETITANPNEIKNAAKNNDKVKVEEIAKNLSDILELDYAETLEKLQKETSHVYIKRKVESDVATRIRELNMTGVYLEEDSKRYYPYGNFASHVIGFTGFDNQGLGGIEMVYEKNLKGVPGRVVSLKNALDTDMPFKHEQHIDPENGTNVVLTIDEVIQHFAEKYLEQAAIENKVAQGAACIVMDIPTGEILAMATKPDFDLNDPFAIVDPNTQQVLEGITDEDEKLKQTNDALQKQWRNKAVADSYEPGSVFKTITASMALEENVVQLTDPFFCSGSKKVGGRSIRCAKAGGHGALDFAGGVTNSCNPVFMEVGARVGYDNFKKYFHAFGFGEVTGFDLPGEAKGTFYADNNFNEVELATASFGQGPTVTPLQLVAAVGAVANDGKLMKPHLIKELVDDEGTTVQSVEPTMVRQVISEQTSDTMCMLLENVVNEGSGQNAYVKGYRVAGKTGTSEKIPRGNGKYVSSFLGFAPANDPKVLCLVLLDEANGDSYYGGAIAAPVVRNIMEDTLRYLNIEPQYTAEEAATLDVYVPEVKGMSVTDAGKRINDEKLKYKVIGSGETVKDQMPKMGASMPADSTVILYTEDNAQQTAVVPKVTGFNVATATNELAAQRLNISIGGMGRTGKNTAQVYASKQDPAPGATVPIGTVVNVEFSYLATD